jgi:large subunit ribosomal protein L35
MVALPVGGNAQAGTAPQQIRPSRLLFFCVPSAINPAFRRPAKGLPWRRIVLTHMLDFELMPVNRAFGSCFRPDQESQMPKIKTKSGAKKRFKITGTGKVLFAQSRKRHGMIKRTKKQIRQLRGTSVLFKTDGDNIKKYWLPNG